MKILVIYPFLTHPINAGNRAAVMGMVEILQQLGHEVFMLCISIPGLRQNYDADIKATNEYWGDHGFIYKASLIERFFHSVKINFIEKFRSGFYKCDDMYPKHLDKIIKKLNNIYHFEACICNYYWTTKALLLFKNRKTILFSHDSFAFRNELTGFRNAWQCTTPDQEAKGVRRAKYILALQDEEANYFKHLSPLSKVLTIYSYYKIKDLPLTYNHNIVMLSSGGQLNYSGIVWFLDKIFPHILEFFPDCNLHIAGSLCNLLKNKTLSEKVKLHGYVDNPEDLYKLGDIAINPCFSGTGIKIKTFEALTYGRIIMCHPHSTKGIYKKEQAPVFASTDYKDWVNELEKLWGKKDFLREKHKDGLSYIEDMDRFIVNEYKIMFNSQD